MRKICLLVFLSLLVAVGGQVLALDLEYLRLNSEPILADPDFHLLLEGLEGKKIFMAGEAHGVGINSELAFNLLLFLHKNAQVRYFIWEGGYALGNMLNRYVQGGEELLLEMSFSQLEGTALWSEEKYDFFRRLYEFNALLAPEKRIEVIGIDLDLPLTAPVLFLDYLLAEKEAENLEPLRDLAADYRKLEGDVQQYSYRVRRETLQLAVLLEEKIEREGEHLEKTLGDDWPDFKHTVASLLRTHRVWGEGPQAREDNSFSNLRELDSDLERGAFFAQWGGNHVLQGNQAGVDWLGSLLNSESSPWAGQVLSIYYIYDHCRLMEPKTYREVDYSSREVRELETLRRAAPSEVTMFWLAAPGSPFSEEIHFLSRPSRGVTTDYFQYIIMIRNQGASSPLKVANE